MAAHVSEQVSEHVARLGCYRNETFEQEKKMASTLNPCVGCGGLLGCVSDCRGSPETEEMRSKRVEEARVEAQIRVARKKWKWTPPAQNPYGSCECDELDYDGECNACLWDERLRDGLLGKDRRCLDCPDCRVYGEECPGCNWK